MESGGSRLKSDVVLSKPIGKFSVDNLDRINDACSLARFTTLFLSAGPKVLRSLCLTGKIRGMKEVVWCLTSVS